MGAEEKKYLSENVREKSVLEGWNSTSTLQSSVGSQHSNNNALQTSSSNSSCDSIKSQEANSWQQTAVALKKVRKVHL